MHNNNISPFFKVLFYISSSGSSGICFRGKGAVFLRSSDLDDQIKTLGWTIVALFLSVVWLAFNPIWFPQAKLEYDFMRMFLMFTALLGVFTAYLIYKRKLNMK